MDNSALVIITVVEAIVIVWLASKLKQYQKFERLLTSTATENANPETGESSIASDSRASAAASAVAHSVGAGLSDEAEEADLLDMPGVDPEANIEEAKRVQLVMARCRYAEFYLEQLDDDYERGQFQQIVSSCMNTARNIADPFFRSSALEPLILLLDKADWHEQRDQLLSELSDELVRQRVDGVLKSEMSEVT